MDKELLEKFRQQREQNKFNSITRSVKVKNQNQEHNVRQEGIGKQNQIR